MKLDAAERGGRRSGGARHDTAFTKRRMGQARLVSSSRRLRALSHALLVLSLVALGTGGSTRRRAERMRRGAESQRRREELEDKVRSNANLLFVAKRGRELGGAAV